MYTQELRESTDVESGGRRSDKSGRFIIIIITFILIVINISCY